MTYYYIQCHGLVAKGENSPFMPKYIYDKEKGWVLDEWSIVNDYLMGWDAGEDDLAWRGGHTEIMELIKEISYEQAKIILKDDYSFTLGDEPRRYNP